MSTMQPRPSRGASGSAPRSTPPVAGPRATPRPSAPLRILLAGVDKDDRGAVEDAVRQGLGSRAASEPWSVSVVQMAGKLSLTIDGGGLQGASLVTDRLSLAEAIRTLVGSDRGPGAESAAPSPGPRTEVRDRHTCERCGKGLLVVYEAEPDEPRELAPVACPHCWTIGHVGVGAWAAGGKDYRSEKA